MASILQEKSKDFALQIIKVCNEIKLSKRESVLRQHRTIASADLSGSFAPFLQFQKREIHTVFPRFWNFELAQNLSLRFLDELCGVALTNQLIRSGTSIGANIREAMYAHGKADFIAKLQIALKECSESEYWLELLIESGYYEDKRILEQCVEI